MKEILISSLPGYENIEGYTISENGDVFSWKSKNKRKLKPYPNTKGYLLVDLSKTRRAQKVHRLVAMGFIDNPNGFEQVNHINGIKTDNRASNLEWVNNSLNVRHAHKNGLIDSKKWAGENNYQYNKPHKYNKAVIQMDMNGNVIAEYHSQAMAARAIGRPTSYYKHISQACKGITESAGGYKWKYKS